MGLVWGSGFDYISSGGALGENYIFDMFSGGGYVERGSGRYGGYAIQFPTLGSVSRWVRHSMPVEMSTITHGFALYLDATAPIDNTPIAYWYAADETVQFVLRLMTDYSLKITRGGTTTALIQTAAGVVPASDWCYIEYTVFVNDTTGTAEIWVDDVSEASGTSLDTRTSTGGSNVHTLLFGSEISGATRPLQKFDDMYVRNDTTRYGPCRWEYIPPSGDTADADGTPSTGSTNYGVVDETTGASDTDYLSLDTAGDLVLFDHSGLSEDPVDVWAVQIVTGMAKIEAGDRIMNHVLKQSSTEYNGADFGFGGPTGRHVSNVWETNPATSTAWTTATVNSVKFGIEIIS